MDTIVTAGVISISDANGRRTGCVHIGYDTDGGVSMRVNRLGDEVVVKFPGRTALQIADLLTRAAQGNRCPHCYGTGRQMGAFDGPGSEPCGFCNGDGER